MVNQNEIDNSIDEGNIINFLNSINSRNAEIPKKTPDSLSELK